MNTMTDDDDNRISGAIIMIVIFVVILLGQSLGKEFGNLRQRIIHQRAREAVEQKEP